MMHGIHHPGCGFVLICMLLGLAGCGDNMGNQPKVDTMEASAYLPEATARHPLPESTVPRGEPWNNLPFVTGRAVSGEYLGTAPIGYTGDSIRAGEELFHIHCVVCHGPAGYGDGIVARRGFPNPPSFHSDRLRGMPDGYLFDVITNGYGMMPRYRSTVEPQERWQIVTFLRALQLSQYAEYDQLPNEVQAQLSNSVEGD